MLLGRGKFSDTCPAMVGNSAKLRVSVTHQIEPGFSSETRLGLEFGIGVVKIA